MNRNIAFLISNLKKNSISYQKSLLHLEKLANHHNYQIRSFKINKINLSIVYSESVEFIHANECITFPIGNLGNNALETDRFLEISISPKSISIRNDYAGSIPVFYFFENNLLISNIEPCVVKGVYPKAKSLNESSIFGFMRYSHLIDNETIFKNIYSNEPDSLYTFEIESNSINIENLNSIDYSVSRKNMSKKDVAEQFYYLNKQLVHNALLSYDVIILPLSSGYDSRLILAAISEIPELKEKLYCFTYGTPGSVEEVSARLMTNKLGIKWQFIELPCSFLEKPFLFEIHDIFGSSMHMHGMYQLEFFTKLANFIPSFSNACLTSGFMTGVPAGQHNSLLNISNDSIPGESMNNFFQSQIWSRKELESYDAFSHEDYHLVALSRFQKSFNRSNGLTYQKAVMFDIWTRQRNFIGYYPRTLEWKLPVVSPHMNPEYVNFFMSLSKKHLDDRFIVEEMFRNHYPYLAHVASNSNGLKTLKKSPENLIYFMSRIFRFFKLNHILPSKYADLQFDFDTAALNNSKVDGVYPLLANTYDEVLAPLFNLIPKKIIQQIYLQALEGSAKDYCKLLTLQSIALSLIDQND